MKEISLIIETLKYKRPVVPVCQIKCLMLLAVSKPLAISKRPNIPLGRFDTSPVDIGGQVCSVAFKCNSCNTIENLYIY